MGFLGLIRFSIDIIFTFDTFENIQENHTSTWNAIIFIYYMLADIIPIFLFLRVLSKSTKRSSNSAILDNNTILNNNTILDNNTIDITLKFKLTLSDNGINSFISCFTFSQILRVKNLS